LLLSYRLQLMAKMESHYNVLFLCTGNSARSIMAEGIMNFKGRPQFTAFSAGSHPAGRVHPGALHQLEIAHIPTSAFRSKSWTNSQDPTRRRSTSSSPFATMRRTRFAQCGPGTPCLPIGGFLIPPPSPGRRKRYKGLSAMPSFCWIAESVFFFAFLMRR
jgi:Low molecular weight phosphotyrosine protein phosphatase